MPVNSRAVITSICHVSSLALNNIHPSIEHYQLATVKSKRRMDQLMHWHGNGGVMIMGYDMYRRLANGLGMRTKRLKNEAFNCLVDPGPDIISKYFS
jgi:hypothetical protein